MRSRRLGYYMTARFIYTPKRAVIFRLADASFLIAAGSSARIDGRSRNLINRRCYSSRILSSLLNNSAAFSEY